MHKKFLTARSPLRLLEKGLHGGLGKGHLGLVLAGHGVGKTSFLVGVALDDLLRGDPVLHIVLDQTVAHTRTYYETVFNELAKSTQLPDAATTAGEIAQRRSIRAYGREDFNAKRLRDAVAHELDAGLKPAVVIVEGLPAEALGAEELTRWRDVAQDLPAEIWISVAHDLASDDALPEALAAERSRLDVILALEPQPDAVVLRALKDHDNPDVTALRVALDPRTLLLKRN